jgi:hypothetical protein
VIPSSILLVWLSPTVLLACTLYSGPYGTWGGALLQAREGLQARLDNPEARPQYGGRGGHGLDGRETVDAYVAPTNPRPCPAGFATQLKGYRGLAPPIAPEG